MLIGVEVTRLTVEDDIQVYYPVEDGEGTIEGDSVPLNSTFVISARTDRTGRSFRGRNYIPGLSASLVASPGLMEFAWVGAYVTGVLAQLTTNLPVFWTYVIASSWSNKVQRLTRLLTPVTGLLIDTALDSMRRRLVGRGT